MQDIHVRLLTKEEGQARHHDLQAFLQNTSLVLTFGSAPLKETQENSSKL